MFRLLILSLAGWAAWRIAQENGQAAPAAPVRKASVSTRGRGAKSR